MSHFIYFSCHWRVHWSNNRFTFGVGLNLTFAYWISFHVFFRVKSFKTNFWSVGIVGTKSIILVSGLHKFPKKVSHFICDCFKTIINVLKLPKSSFQRTFCRSCWDLLCRIFFYFNRLCFIFWTLQHAKSVIIFKQKVLQIFFSIFMSWQLV